MESQARAFDLLPDDALVHKDVLIGNARRGTLGIWPRCKSMLYLDIQEGRFPPPLKLGHRSVWRVGDVRRALADIATA